MIYLGTSGWNYAHWRRTFYPEKLPQRQWLEYYAQRFATVELNNSFYRLPSREQFESWRERSPDDFVVTVKMSRYLTHIKRLQDPEEPVARFMKHARGLGSKMGPILVQLPPTLKADLGALDEALRRFPEDVRVVVEFRHDTWFTEDVLRVLEERGACWCLADRLARPVTPVWRTTEWTFLRFHEGRAKPHPCYGKDVLATWVERLAHGWGTDADIYVYFNNDPRACAIRDAIVFARLAEAAGFEVTRAPRPDEVTIGGADSEAWSTPEYQEKLKA